MRFSARAFIATLFLTLFTAVLAPFHASAQTYPTAAPVAPSANHDQYASIDPAIPTNQHARVQTLVIDVLSAVACQLGGIDPVDPKRPCIDINPVTRKLGYSTTQFNENGQPKMGGLVGASTYMVSAMYTPSASATHYGEYIAQNFGIVKSAHAQNDNGYGFTSLNPLLTLWTAVRNVAYFFLMVAFVLIGLGIMLRVKVDPRTVMSLQNQIPRIIICILLVTFSYPIAGAMIDGMWLSTYVGINVITSAGGTAGGTNLLDNTNEPLSQLATQNLLQTPLTFVNSVFKTNDDSGIGHLTDEISFGLGSFLEELVRTFFGVTFNDSCVGWTGLNLGACLASVFGFIASILMWLIILITLLKTLFSVWFTLLKAYTYVIFYVIAAPIIIILGLLSNKFGVENWLRSLLANLAPFALTAWMFMIARLFMQLFQGTTADQFIPPLIFQPNMGVWGVMLAFGVFLMTPTVLAMMQEALKVPGTKYGSAIGQGLAAGAAVPKEGFEHFWDRATRKFKPYEHEAGYLRQWISGGIGQKYKPDMHVSVKSPKTWIPGAKNYIYKKASQATHGVGSSPGSKGGH